MIVIADNDVLLKLARCDLFDEFMQTFEVSHEDIYILNTAKPVLSQEEAQPDRRRQLPAPHGLLNAVQIIGIAPDADEQVALAEQQNIDTGEAVLFSVTHQVKNSLLTTGDKRSLTSLAKAEDAVCRRLCKKLANKVVCFEQILLKILDAYDFDAVCDKLINGRECDKVLAIVIGSGLDAQEANVREGLTSYLNDLRNQTGSLLIDP